MTSATSGNRLLRDIALELVEPRLRACGIPLDELPALQAHVVRQQAEALRQRMERKQPKAAGRPSASGMPAEMLAAVVAHYRLGLASRLTQRAAAERTARQFGISKSLPRTAASLLWRLLKHADPGASAEEIDRRAEALTSHAERISTDLRKTPDFSCRRSA